MKLHAVAEIVDLRAGETPRSPRFDWPYREFFHGSSSAVLNRYGERPYKPLPLIRNVRLMPSIFFPTVGMVVGRDVARQLAKFDGVDLNRCAWDGVYDLPIDDASLLNLKNRFPVFGNGFSEWLRQQMHQSNSDLPEYFEVIAAPHDIVAKSFTCDTPIQLPSPVFEKLKPIWTCAKLHQLYPIVTVLPYYLFVEETWRVVEPHVSDPDLFTVRSFDMGERYGKRKICHE